MKACVCFTVVCLGVLFWPRSSASETLRSTPKHWSTIRTQEVQNDLRRRQSNCSAPTLSIAGHHDGLGSSIHVLSGALAMAHNTGFVLDYGSWGSNWTRGSDCDTPGFACLFMPLSSCPVRTTHDLVLDVNKPGVIGDIQKAVPTHYSRDASTSSDEFRQWWRAQGSMFIVNPTASTASRVAAVRKMLGIGSLPPGTASMHVRRADKITEADPTPLRFYFDSLHRSWVGRRVFLTTDGQEVADELDALLFQSAAGWTVIRPTNSTFTPLGGTETFSYDLALRSLAMLSAHVEADVFIGTRSSNWCRLIDELRRREKFPACCRPYLDVAPPKPKIPFWNFVERSRRKKRDEFFRMW